MVKAPLLLILIAGLASADEKQADEKPRVSFGELTVTTGKYDAKVVARVVKKRARDLVGCYSKTLARAPIPNGDVNVAFTIDGKGAAASVTADGIAPGVYRCVAEVFQKLVFVKPKGGSPVEVTYVLTFSRGPSGDDDSNIYGGLLGTEAGEMNGGFGFGRGGFGPGGGGTGWGTIGTGRYGVIGKGSGTGSGYGLGGARARKLDAPTLTLGTPTIDGALDKAIIRRYLKRNYQKLMYCYEKQLSTNNKLEGTVTARLTIEPDGKVSSASAKGVDANIETCVAGVVKGIEFPKPKSGTVTATWPLVYKKPAPKK